MEDRPSHACQEMHIQLQHGTPTQILLNILRLQPEVFFLYTSLTSLLLIFFFTFFRDCFRLCRSFGDHSEKDISILKQGSKLSLKTKRYEQKLWAGFTLTLRSPSHKATNLWDLLASQGSYQIYLSTIPFQPLMSKIHIFSCWIKD